MNKSFKEILQTTDFADLFLKRLVLVLLPSEQLIWSGKITFLANAECQVAQISRETKHLYHAPQNYKGKDGVM